MILRDTYGWTVALESDCDVGLRRFAGLTAARRFLDAVLAIGIIPTGRPFRLFFAGQARSIPLREPVSGRELYSREEAESVARAAYPGLWSEVCN